MAPVVGRQAPGGHNLGLVAQPVPQHNAHDDGSQCSQAQVLQVQPAASGLLAAVGS